MFGRVSKRKAEESPLWRPIMRNISQLVASLMLLATQVNVPFMDIAASGQASASTVGQYEVSLKTNTSDAVVVAGKTQLNYEADVLAPLRAAQAEAAAKAAEARKARAKRTVRTATARNLAPATAENMARLRLCEAGGIYSRNSGNGYYGAYQYNLSTWANYGGYKYPHLAPAAVQDAKFLETFSRRGWQPWPACSRKLGLR